MNPKQQAGDQRGRLSSRIFWPEPTGDASCWKSEISYLCGRWTALLGTLVASQCKSRQQDLRATARMCFEHARCAVYPPKPVEGRGARLAHAQQLRVSHQKWPFEPKSPQEYRGQKGALGDFPLVEPPKSRVGFVNPPLCCCQRHFPFGPHVGSAGLFSTIAIRSRPALRWEPAGCWAQTHAPCA